MLEPRLPRSKIDKVIEEETPSSFLTMVFPSSLLSSSPLV